MSTKLASIIRKLVVKFWLSLKRFPLSILMAASAVILSIVLNHLAPNANENLRNLFTKTIRIFALGFPLFLCIKVFFERKPQIKFNAKAAVYLSGIIILVLYYAFLPQKLNPVSEARYWIYSLVLYLLFLSIPMLFREESYELYVVKLFTSFVTVLLYSIILYAGVSAVIASTVLLFKLNISGKIYFDMAAIIFGLVGPVLFLSYIPLYGENLYVQNYPKVLRILFLYIILPILSLFSGIFYLYFLTILFKPWPSNTIFRISFYFILCSLIAIFFIYPLRNINRWAKAFSMFFPKLLLPFLILMFMSLIIRIHAYGFTFIRYFLFTAAVWMAFSLVYLSFVKDSKNILMLMSLTVLLFLAVTGPWNFSSITNLSQSSRFNRLLLKYDMLQNSKIVKSSKEISEEDKVSLSSIVSYYGRNYNFKELKYLPDDFSENKMKDVFGFDPVYYPLNYSRDNRYFYNLAEENYVINIRDYNYMISAIYNNENKTEISNGSLDIVIDKSIISIKNKGVKIYTKNLTELIGKISSGNGNKNALTAEEMTITDGNENLDISYIINNIDFAKDLNSSDIRIYQMNLKLLIKLKQ